MVKSKIIYSPQNYLMAVTGNCYVIEGDNDIETVGKILEEEGYCYWTYPLEEIDYIVENKLNVVLVDYMVWNACIDEFEHTYRWTEVPEDFEEK